MGLVITALLQRRARTNLPADLHVAPLTSNTGLELHPAFSPDATRVAYAWTVPPHPSAIYVKLNGPGDPVKISKDLTLVGRKEDCDLRLDHKSISKQHCVIVKTDGLLLLRDLGSTNGTRVNGQRVRRAALLPNDQLSIANFKFRVFLGPDAAPVPDPELHTQAIDADEVAELMRKGRGDEASEPEMPVLPLQRNQLPDVIDDGKGKR